MVIVVTMVIKAIKAIKVIVVILVIVVISILRLQGPEAHRDLVMLPIEIVSTRASYLLNNTNFKIFHKKMGNWYIWQIKL